ncbi:MAG: CHAT domain-containing protein [bacterium]|nr:CHAT domain-containing protein [bacterium]
MTLHKSIVGLLAALLFVGCSSEGPLESARSLIAESKFDEARAAASAVLERAEADRGADSLPAAEAIDVIVECTWRSQSSTPETLDLAERALRIKNAHHGADSLEAAETLNQVASVHLDLRGRANTEKARDLYLDVLDVARAAGDARHEARALHNLGETHRRLREYAVARDYLRQATVLKRATPDSQAELAATLQVSMLVDNADGAYGMALEKMPDLERALTREFGERHQRQASRLHLAGHLAFKTGDYFSALADTERALEMRSEFFGEESAAVASTTNLRAALYVKLGDHERARPLFERVLEIRQAAASGPDDPRVGGAMTNLGFLLMLTEERDRSRELLEEGLRIREANYPTEDRRVVVTTFYLAMLDERSGDTTSARARFERTLELQRAALDADHPRLAWTLHNYGAFLTRIHAFDDARTALGDALEIRRARLGSDHPLTALTEAALARLAFLSAEWNRALAGALKVERSVSKHSRDVAGWLSEAQALRFAAVRASGEDMALSLLLDGRVSDARVRDVWWSVMRSRGEILDQIMRQNRLARVVDPVFRERHRELQLAKERYASAVHGGDEGFAKLASTREDLEKAERDYRELARELVPAAADYDDVIDAVPHDAALVAVKQFDRWTGALAPSGDPEARPTYLAFVWHAGLDAPAVVDLGPAADVDRLVRRWRRDVLSASDAHRRSGAELRAAVWDPIVARTDASRRVFFVPDGALHLVSLAALPTDAERYLIEDGPLLHQLSAERDLARPVRRRNAGSGLLAMGGPSFDRRARSAGDTGSVFRGERAGCRGFSEMRFDELPHAAAEIREISSVWGESDAGDATTLTGDRALESTFKRQAAGKRVIHLATHGFFLGDECTSLGSGRGLKLVEREAAETSPSTGGADSPLVLTGLALAGFNDRTARADDEEDGVLTAEEIGALELGGVDWAVLSACGTGLGEIHPGEGVFGLHRAFLGAGVGTVVMSLWPVADEPTRDWMRELYAARLERGHSTAESLRAAGLRMLSAGRERGETPHPVYWGAFVATGDWR